MIAGKIKETLEEWGIPRSKVLLIISDNGSNMLKAMKTLNADEKDDECETESDDEEEVTDGGEGTDDTVEILTQKEKFHLLPCLAHSLQLVVKELRQDPNFGELVDKARGIVRKIRVSSVATEKLTELAGKGVVIDCPTRWNSTLHMLQRLLELRPSLPEVLQNLKVDNLTFSDWEKVDEICRLLHPFAVQTDTLQKDMYALSQAIPALLDLDCHLDEESDMEPLVAGVSRSGILIRSLRKRFDQILNPAHPTFEVIPAAACLLDYETAPFLLAPSMESLCAAAKAYITRQVR